MTSMTKATVFSRPMLWQHLLAAPVAILIVLGLAWSRMDPLIVLDSEMLTPRVERLGWVSVRREVHWIRWDCTDIRLSADLVDSVKEHHPRFSVDAPGSAPRPQGSATNSDWQVPLSMAWGKAEYHGYLDFSCAPFFNLWPIRMSLPIMRFEVDKSLP